jgi:hypothetical protein
MASAWRYPTGDHNIRATTPLTENSAGIAQASFADPFDRKRLAVDGQIGSGPTARSTHFYGSREHSQYGLFRPAAALMAC